MTTGRLKKVLGDKFSPVQTIAAMAFAGGLDLNVMEAALRAEADGGPAWFLGHISSMAKMKGRKGGADASGELATLLEQLAVDGRGDDETTPTFNTNRGSLDAGLRGLEKLGIILGAVYGEDSRLPRELAILKNTFLELRVEYQADELPPAAAQILDAKLAKLLRCFYSLLCSSIRELVSAYLDGRAPAVHTVSL